MSKIEEEENKISIFEKDQHNLLKINRMAAEDPMRLVSELHEAHYLLESNVISQTCYDRVKQIVEVVSRKLNYLFEFPIAYLSLFDTLVQKKRI